LSRKRKRRGNVTTIRPTTLPQVKRGSFSPASLARGAPTAVHAKRLRPLMAPSIAFMLHIYAALAEKERQMISERTKAAMKAAKIRGVAVG
jgi:hypothetical protein